ncbi:hypothetical protein [Nonomuraea sp. NEAU-A123]|uniref:hypothetical protein n=1 Tax=Nonomuraea sp. NEAU-A123 TaxID=2839649 RepID=UPI001BE4D164|nr:hypothetical protein [Nonomuraea sp. NEAU-A123]MBT2225992.1 hypothetical protein [Nonomuraea sp. NEAU-A123]
MADIPLFVISLALLAAIGVLVLFVVLVCGIRADDRHRNLSDRPHSGVERVARRVLMHARRPRPDDSTPAPGSHQARR